MQVLTNTFDMIKRILIATALLLGTILICIPCSASPSGKKRDKVARILENNKEIIRVEATGVSKVMNVAITMAQTNGNVLIAQTISEEQNVSDVTLKDVIIVERKVLREKSGAYKAVLVLEMKKGDDGKKD